MIRLLVIAGAVLVVLGGVALPLSRPDIPDPGPPIVIDAVPSDAATPDAKDADAKAGRGDADKQEFKVVAPRPVKADGDDWDDDDDDD